MKKKLSEIIRIERFIKAQILIPVIGAIAGGLAWWALSTYILPRFEPKAPAQKPTIEKIIIEKTIIVKDGKQVVKPSPKPSIKLMK